MLSLFKTLHPLGFLTLLGSSFLLFSVSFAALKVAAPSSKGWPAPGSSSPLFSILLPRSGVLSLGCILGSPGDPPMFRRHPRPIKSTSLGVKAGYQYLFFVLAFVFLGLYLQHMEVPQLGVESEL